MSGHRIVGTGIDLVENARIESMRRKWGVRFLDRVFLAGEQAYSESRSAPAHHYAGRFAVKEAVSKAFGTGFGASLGWLDIEVTRDEETGAPRVVLGGKGRSLAAERGVSDVLVSLSHTRTHTVAYAMLVAEE